jgi:predicted permease
LADLLSVTVPIFLLIAMGFFAVRIGIVRPDFIHGLGLFVLGFLLPALVLHALLGQDLRQTFNWAYVGAYAAGSLVTFLAALLLFSFWLGRNLSHAAIASLGGVASNSGFVGFPIATLAVGAPALTALPLTMLVENALVIPLALGLAEAGQQNGKSLAAVARGTLLRLSRTPLMVAILLGIILSASGFQLPDPISTSIGMVADASAACALFVVGGTLAGVTSAPLARDLAWIVAAKLLFHPLAVAGAFLLLGGVPAGLIAAGIILASAPMLTAYPIFGQRFGLGALCATALVAATAAGFATMTAAVGIVARDPAQLTAVPAERHIWLPGAGEDGKAFAGQATRRDAAPAAPAQSEAYGA